MNMLTLLILITIPSLPDTLHVPNDYPTIQAAINAATGGDMVVVAPGTYVENIDFLGKAISVTSELGSFFTTIDGGRQGSVVRFNNSEGPGSVLQGFRITNGSGWEGRGGGVYCGEGCSPGIMKNEIIDDFRGQTQQEMISMIRERLPTQEGDKRSIDPNDALIAKLTNICASLAKREALLDEGKKGKIRELISWMEEITK